MMLKSYLPGENQGFVILKRKTDFFRMDGKNTHETV